MLFFRQIVAPCSNSNAAPLFVCCSVGLSFCGTDIFLIFSNGCLNAAGDVVTSACLADAEHCVRFFFCNGSGYGCDGFAEDLRRDQMRLKEVSWENLLVCAICNCVETPSLCAGTIAYNIGKLCYNKW